MERKNLYTYSESLPYTPDDIEFNATVLDKIMSNQQIMRGIGFDIANSKNLKESEKQELLRGCEALLYMESPLQKRHKHLLWKIRKDYHIILSGLDQQAEPSSFWDRLLY